MRTAVFVTDKPSPCWHEDVIEVPCPDPAVVVYIDRMVSEDVPAMYPPGSERQASRSRTAACPRHLWELAAEYTP